MPAPGSVESLDPLTDGRSRNRLRLLQDHARSPPPRIAVSARRRRVAAGEKAGMAAVTRSPPDLAGEPLNPRR